MLNSPICNFCVFSDKRFLMRIIALLVLVAFFSGVPTEKKNYELSLALGLGETGINKVLCLSDGKTMLFHFENNKPIAVMVFDASRKRVANVTIENELMDVFLLSTSLFKGLYEINGEGVVFFEQQLNSRRALIRLRFDATSGRLIDEAIVEKSKGALRPMRFFVMKQPKEKGYAILYSQEQPQFRKCKNRLVYYNERHEAYKEVALAFDRKRYDYMRVIGAECRAEGIFVTLSLSDMIVNGTGNTIARRPVYKHYMHVFFVPNGSDAAVHSAMNLETELLPYYTQYTYNPFADNLNVLLTGYSDAVLQYGVDLRPVSFVNTRLFRLSPASLSGQVNWVTDTAARKVLLEATKDSVADFTGFPVRMFTNERGLTTIVSESYERNYTSETGVSTLVSDPSGYYQPGGSLQQSMATGSFSAGGRLSNFGQNSYSMSPLQQSSSRSSVFETYHGNVCITQLDDNGNELWGTVLPKTIMYRSYNHYYQPINLAKRWQEQEMYNDRPQEVFDRQFMSMNVVEKNGDFYIIYNDGTSNIDNSLSQPGDTVFVSALSNACYYKVDRKHNVSKSFLFDTPLENEYCSSFIEGADFDDKRGTYASLVRYKRGSYVSMRMAWVKLD